MVGMGRYGHYATHTTAGVSDGMVLICVAQVNLSNLPSIATWKRDFTMETILIEIRRFMAAPNNKKLPQPPEGTNF
jgi:ubiquitin-protein ligase